MANTGPAPINIPQTTLSPLHDTADATSTVDLGGQIAILPTQTLDQAENTAAQTAAWGAQRTGNAIFIAGTSAAAALTAQKVLQDDLQSGASNVTIVGDELAVLGNEVAAIGGVAKLVGDNKLFLACEIVGDGLVLLSHQVSLLEFADSNIPLGGVESVAASDISSLESTVSGDSGASFGNLWDPAQSSVLTAATSASSMLNDIDNAAFLTDANNTSTFLGDTTSPITNLYYGAGGTPQDLDETATATDTGASVATTDASTSSLDDTASVATNADATSTTLDSTGTDGNTLSSETGSVDSSGDYTDTVDTYDASGDLEETTTTVTADPGTSTVTTSNSSGSTVTHYSGPNGTGTPGQSEILLQYLSDGKSYTAGVSFGTTSFVLPSVRAFAPTSTSYGTTANFVAGNLNPSSGNSINFDLPWAVTNPQSLSPSLTSEAITFNTSQLNLGNTPGDYSDVTVTVGDVDYDENAGANVDFTLSGKVYGWAVAQTSFASGAGPQTYYFHVGDNASVAMQVTNEAIGALTDTLRVGVAAGSAAGDVTGVSSPGDIAQNQTATVMVGIGTGTAGTYTLGTGNLDFISHDPDLADATASASGYSATVNVNAYAQPTLVNTSTAMQTGTLTGSGTSYTLNFGQEIWNNNNPTATEALIEIDDGNGTIPMDSLEAGASAAGSGFSDSYTLPFQGETANAGGSILLGQFSPDVTSLGQHSETIVILPTGFNPSGYSGALPNITLTIVDDVVPQQNISVAGAIAAYNDLNSITGLTISDTAADVAAAIDTLQVPASHGSIASITLSDVGTGTITLTAAQLTADAGALAKIVSKYALNVSDPTSLSYTLANNVTSLTLTGSGSANVTGNASGDTIVANGGADVLTGGSGNDIIHGGAGGDTLNGGAGDDTFYAGTGATTINGGSGFDKAVFNFASSLVTETHDANGSWTVTGNGYSDTLTGVEELAFSGKTISLQTRAADDFSQSGTSDILFRNNATGDTGLYIMSNGVFQKWDDIGASSTAYSIVGTGDFLGNGGQNVLYEDLTSGDVGYYQVNAAGSLVGWTDIGPASTTYTIVGTGDFYDTGQDEILFRNNATGDTGFYALNASGTFAGWHDIGASSTAYSIVGVGDFNGDGTSDVLYRDAATGDAGWYQVNNGALTTWTDIGTTSTAYSVVGVGDFLGNGMEEALFRVSSGDMGFYTVASGVATWHDIGASASSYAVIGAGNYAGDATSDILFRNTTTGDTGFYQIENGANTGWHDIGATSTAYNVHT